MATGNSPGSSVTVNVGALTQAITVAIQEATSSPSGSQLRTPTASSSDTAVQQSSSSSQRGNSR